jgi:hypothetical protein
LLFYSEHEVKAHQSTGISRRLVELLADSQLRSMFPFMLAEFQLYIKVAVFSFATIEEVLAF